MVADEIYERYGPYMEQFQLPWLTFCTGNLSLRKEHFQQLGGFDQNFKRFEDWEFGYRFYQTGGQFIFGEKCEAFQQLGPISPNRRDTQKTAYQLFCRKHSDVAVHLLALMLFSGFDYTQLSSIFEQHQHIKKDNAELAAQMEKSLKHYANGKKIKRLSEDFDPAMFTGDYPEWAALYQTLQGIGD